MAPRIESYRVEKTQFGMHPRKFLLWVFLVTVTMFFAAFTSAMVVRRADGNWAWFQLPNEFIVSCVLAVLSSAALQWAWYSAKRNNITTLRLTLWAALIFGSAFLYSQWMGYKALVDIGVYLTGNPSGSFFYVVAGLHAIHVFGGIIALVMTLVQAYRYRVHSRNLLGINMTTTYWHFIGGLWIYLFAILSALR